MQFLKEHDERIFTGIISDSSNLDWILDGCLGLRVRLVWTESYEALGREKR